MMTKKFIVTLMILASLSITVAGCNKGSSEQAEKSANQFTEQTGTNAETNSAQ